MFNIPGNTGQQLTFLHYITLYILLCIFMQYTDQKTLSFSMTPSKICKDFFRQ